ncbi:hypothetical protein [uncultured Aquimarina sp.]|uniref:hypothetical protein n=1 Tax=uncultured Aquimarina sp. TaxID=575652 RepID=UPI0026039E0E|nr:hypothetical protein [uncultured Aquimarina sp.]
MKVIHWTPKENKSGILENGIKLNDTWISCSILSPFKNLNRWWLDFLLNDKEYIGFIFELNESDFPLVHSHLVIDSHTEYDENHEVVSKKRLGLNEILNSNPNSVFANIDGLKNDYKKTIIWRIGNTVDNSDYLDKDGIYKSDDKKIMNSGLKLIKQSLKKADEKFFNNPDFMKFVFEDYEVLLFKDIKPERIEKVIKSNTDYKYSDLINEIKNTL